MKSFIFKFVVRPLFLSCFFIYSMDSAPAKLSKNLLVKTDAFTASFMGRFTQEHFGAQSARFLNSDIDNDCTSYQRSTVDYTFDVMHGIVEQPRVAFHETFRMRHKWGSETDARGSDSFALVADVAVPVKGKHLNKHLIWSREAWVKVALGNLNYPNNNFIQIGLIPFEVGRGISLGAAYAVDGFLGFSPGDSIDQFAPAVLLSLNPIAEKFSVDFYTAILENHTIGFKSNNAPIRKGDLGVKCPARGLPGQSYIVALRSMVKLMDGAKEKLSVEPYIVHQEGPDQDLEFTTDVQSHVTTYGCAIEGVNGRFNWGFEGAMNQGDHFIKPWDRNVLKVVNNPSLGALSEQYTKIYTSDPSITKSPALAYANTTSIAAVANSTKDPSMNGKQIASGLWNAFDRFRPAQQLDLEGFFLMADASYECIEKVLVASLGVGYASGYIDPQNDTNHMTSAQLMNRKFTGFIPLQSVYSGKRLTQLVVFNKGIPRFNVRNPNANLINQNITPVVQSDSIDEVTNIAFLGGCVDWSPQQLKKSKVKISPNLIGYWSPDASSYVVEPATTSDLSGAVVSPALLAISSNFIGIECTTKFSADIYEQLNVYSYVGFLFPGQHYRDMCGTKIDGQPTGSSVAYICDLGMTYSF